MRTLLALALAPLAGCIIVMDGKDCDASAIGSVVVTVAAADGAVVPDAEVTYSTNLRDWHPCDAFGPEGEWVCGWEVPGDIAVHVEAEGFTPFDDAVFIEQGECHVVPKHLDVVLEADVDPVECDDLAVASVVATVAGAGGEELTGVEVGWSYADEDVEELRPCDPLDGGAWVCGYEVEGALTVVASADGHETAVSDVVVEADECHVITEEVAFELAWLPD